MSAYVVSDDTINFIVSRASELDTHYVYAGQNYPIRGCEQHVAAILYTANVESVNERYAQADVSIGFRFRRYTKPQTIAALLKCIQCFEYQACETNGFEHTIAAKIIDGIRRAAIRAVPGYEAAPWGLN
jgi:hypothetical protein